MSVMYVPPYRVIARELGLASPGSDPSSGGWVNDQFLRFMLRQIVCQLPFSEEAYLNANPDVAEAFKRGDGANAHDHYAEYGYFEEREGAGPKFDEAYYLKNNPDVAVAVKAGEWSAGWAHYRAEGMFEWRSPSAAAERDLQHWRDELAKIRAPEIVPVA